jgi:HK97 family phage portal protein
MRIFGYHLTLTKALPLAPVSSSGGWYPIVREPYTGAWQMNDELTPANLLTNPTVYRCVSLIATDIGKCRCRLVRLDADGIWTETSNPAYTQVLRRPNRYQTPQQFFEAWTIARLLYANVYVYKERDQRGVVRALYVLDSSKIKPLVAPDGGVYYELSPNELAGIVTTTDRLVVPASELIHDRWNCLFHPLVGVPPLYAAGGAAAQALQIQNSSTAFFANGARPAGIVSIPAGIGQDQADRVRDYWKQTAGDVSRGLTRFLTGGSTYQAVTATAVDAQVTEQQKQAANTIAGVFGVPVSMVDSSQQPPYANNEASTLQYRSQCLQTHMTAIENSLDDGLELATDLGTEFDIDDLIYLDSTTKTKTVADAIGAGVMTPNEGRVQFNLPPVPGGDTPYLQMQYVPLDAAAREMPASTRQAAAAPTSATPAEAEPVEP